MSDQPPEDIIELARESALVSPCAKTQRGAVLFNRHTHDWSVRSGAKNLRGTALDPVISTGYNGPPYPFACTASASCRKACGMICMHAEQRALMDALTKAGTRQPNNAYLYLDELRDAELVHVKVEGKRVVPGGGPGCLQCSRLIVETAIRGIWLFELEDIDPPFNPRGAWRFYDALSFHRATMENELGSHQP